MVFIDQRLDRHRSMEQNGELAIDPHKYSPLIFYKVARQFNEEGVVFSTNDVEQLNIHIQKKEQMKKTKKEGRDRGKEEH